jgi:hypothetical protein
MGGKLLEDAVATLIGQVHVENGTETEKRK